MIKNIYTMTALKPSFGMPVHGATFATPACSGSVITERVRQLGGVATDATVVATAQGSFPGTTAWRPPSC
ncbi:MAG: hypothetical protein H0X12_18825 [Nocardioides sp.]|nr:hypothetical protein [Nocardioides sp.]